MLKIDPFRERNSVLFQGNDKHTTVTPFWSGRFMFPNGFAGAIVPLVERDDAVVEGRNCGMKPRV